MSSIRRRRGPRRRKSGGGGGEEGTPVLRGAVGQDTAAMKNIFLTKLKTKNIHRKSNPAHSKVQSQPKLHLITATNCEVHKIV